MAAGLLVVDGLDGPGAGEQLDRAVRPHRQVLLQADTQAFADDLGAYVELLEGAADVVGDLAPAVQAAFAVSDSVMRLYEGVKTVRAAKRAGTVPPDWGASQASQSVHQEPACWVALDSHSSG